MLRTSFNDGWRFRPRKNPFAEVAGPPKPWTDVALPHDALIGQERSADNQPGPQTAYYPDGAFEYIKTFDAPDGYADGRVEVEFDGVYRNAVVYVNGTFAGQRRSGYTPFAVRIDPYLNDTHNEIRIECRTHHDSRWYSGAGIYRDVALVASGPLHIARDGVRITTRTAEEDRAVVDVAITLGNETRRPARAKLDLELVGPDGEVAAAEDLLVSLRPGEPTVARQRLTVPRPSRWSVDNPALYSCRARLLRDDEVVDSADTTCGIRTLQWDAIDGFRINGEVVKLRGGCIHHDNGVLGSAAFARAEERRIEILKAAGYNAIRSAHNPISSAMLDACDRLGVLVMDEAFDTWASPKSDFDYSLDFPTWWREDLAAMVTRDVNHPSVVMYSIGNEIPETGNPWDSQLGRDMVELVKSLDDTRPVTNGINAFLSLASEVRIARNAPAEVAEGLGINTLMAQLKDQDTADVLRSDYITERVDESWSMLDIAGYNYATDRYELDLQRHPQRLIVGTEANLVDLEGTWDLVTANPRVVGDFTWTAWEYLGEVGIVRPADDEHEGFMGLYPWRLAWVGDIDITGRRRSQSFFRETVWGLRSEPHIAVHRPDSPGPARSDYAWSDSIDAWSWPGYEGKPITVDVYSDADEVELLCNGTPVGRTKVGGERRYIARFDTAYQPGELCAVAIRDGKESGRATLCSAGTDVRLQVTADREAIRADGGDLAFVGIALTDRDGIVHVTRDRPVTVTVTGSGVLQGLGSADPTSTNNYTDNTCTTYAGRALAVVRPTGSGGITVTVESADCEPVTVTITGGRA